MVTHLPGDLGLIEVNCDNLVGQRTHQEGSVIKIESTVHLPQRVFVSHGEQRQASPRRHAELILCQTDNTTKGGL